MATGTASWGDQLTANESAQLMRGGGTIPLPRPDVLVVGGGIRRGGYGRRSSPGGCVATSAGDIHPTGWIASGQPHDERRRHSRG